MDIQELVSLNRQAIEGLPETDQPAALRRLVAIVEGDNVENELAEFTLLLRNLIANPERFSGVDDRGLPIYKLTPEDIEAVEQDIRDEEAGIRDFVPEEEVEAEYKRLGLR
jgi:hypothetical protein